MSDTGLSTTDGPLDEQLADLVDELTGLLEAGDARAVEEFIGQQGTHSARLWAILPTLQGLIANSNAQGPLEGKLRRRVDTPLGELGDFRLLRELGRGGMGVVYEAEQVSLHRRVALKVLPMAGMLDERALTRFRNEAQAAAGLHHPHIVPVYGVGCEHGVHYYAMQLIDGESLDHLIAAMRPKAGAELSDGELTDTSCPEPSVGDGPPERQGATATASMLSTKRSSSGRDYARIVAKIGIEAAEGLHHAHEHGVVHRDIKPGNLLIDRWGRAWIADFGLARFGDNVQLTMTGDVVGTLRYMSPEQAGGNRIGVDHRTDIYSLGATLYELLSLRPVFQGANREAILRQIENDEPATLSDSVLRTPPDLETILLKALAKDPRDRYATAADFAADLQRFVDDAPIVARRPTWRQRLARWSRRRRSLAAAAAICCGLILVVASWAVWQVDRERTARRFQQQLADLNERHIAEHRYVANVSVLHHMYEDVCVDPRPHLEQLIPAPGQLDLRGFEWHYLQQRLNTHPQPFAQHQGAAYCARFSPDGRMLATAGVDGVRLWEWPSKYPIKHLQEAVSDVNGIEWSSDGKQLASFSDDGGVRVYRTSDWSLQRHLTFAHHLVGGGFVPGSSQLVVGERNPGEGNPGRLRIIDTNTWETIEDFEVDGRLEGVSISPDGQCVAVASWGGVVVYDTKARETKYLLAQEPQPKACTAVAFAPNRPLLAIGCGNIMIYHLDKGTLVADLRTNGAEGVAFDSSGRKLYSVDRFGKLKMWCESPEGDWKLAHQVLQHEQLWSVASHEDGSVAYTTNKGGICWVNSHALRGPRRLSLARRHLEGWSQVENRSRESYQEWTSRDPAELASGQKKVSWDPIHLHASNQGLSVVVCSANGTVVHDWSHWNKSVAEPEYSRRLGSNYGVTIAICCNVEHFCTAGGNGVLAVLSRKPPYELVTRRPLPIAPRLMALSADGRTLYTVHSLPNEVSFVDAFEFPSLRQLPGNDEAWRKPFHLQPADPEAFRFIAARLPLTQFQELTNRVHRNLFAVSRNEQVVAVIGTTIHILSAADGQIQSVSPNEGIGDRYEGIGGRICLSPDGRILAGVTEDHQVKLWNTVTGRILFTLDPRLERCDAICFTVDGLRLVVSGVAHHGGAELVVWDAADP